MIFFIFSYNRGPWLKNCVRSVEDCAPGATIIVYDDNSNDQETRDILAEIAARHDVRFMDDKKSTDQHGALYTNMQRALDSVRHDEIIYFLQDDVQLVRALTEDDIAFINEYFTRDPKSGFLAPVFLRRITKKRTLDRFIYNNDRAVFECQHKTKQPAAGTFYSDVSITKASHLKAVGWQFAQGEFENEVQARDKFSTMGYMHAPLVMWLPNPTAYRNKKKTLAFRLAEKLNRAALYRFSYMTDADVARLRTRPTSQVAIAEEYLSTELPLKKPWFYHPLKPSRLLRKLDKLENFLKRKLTSR